MSEEMKLITALCEALGFEIHRGIDYKERKEAPKHAIERYNSISGSRERRLVGNPNGMLLIDSEGSYTSRLIKPIVSYKLSRRDEL